MSHALSVCLASSSNWKLRNHRYCSFTVQVSSSTRSLSLRKAIGLRALPNAPYRVISASLSTAAAVLGLQLELRRQPSVSRVWQSIAMVRSQGNKRGTLDSCNIGRPAFVQPCGYQRLILYSRSSSAATLTHLPALDPKEARDGILVFTLQPGNSTLACIRKIGDRPFYPGCQVFIEPAVGIGSAIIIATGVAGPEASLHHSHDVAIRSHLGYEMLGESSVESRWRCNFSKNFSLSMAYLSSRRWASYCSAISLGWPSEGFPVRLRHHLSTSRSPAGRDRTGAASGTVVCPR